MKKIIAFSLWGNNPKYTIGALENIKAQKMLFPDWSCRFYCHTGMHPSDVDKLRNVNDTVEIVLVDEIPYICHMNSPGWFWRFNVLTDNSIDRVVIRDADSRLTQRDLNCVKDWEKSKLPFHIIRDHSLHSTRIMAGMWGATREFINSIDYITLLKQFDNLKYPNIYGIDQEFLARMIYPLIKDKACIHDDWHRYSDEINVRKIPHFRDGNHFIGEPIEI